MGLTPEAIIDQTLMAVTYSKERHIIATPALTGDYLGT